MFITLTIMFFIILGVIAALGMIGSESKLPNTDDGYGDKEKEFLDLYLNLVEHNGGSVARGSDLSRRIIELGYSTHSSTLYGFRITMCGRVIDAMLYTRCVMITLDKQEV